MTPAVPAQMAGGQTEILRAEIEAPTASTPLRRNDRADDRLATATDRPTTQFDAPVPYGSPRRKPHEPSARSRTTLVACGSQPPDATVPQTSQAVATEADLPSCDTKHRGALYFVEDDERFVVCKADGWAEIDLRGARGTTGASGAMGVTGAAAQGSFVTASIHCSGQLSGTGYDASYDAAVFRSNDVYARGSIYGASFERSVTEFYAAAQNGAQTASVILTYDIEGAVNAGWWTLELKRTTLVQTVTYHDVDSPGVFKTDPDAADAWDRKIERRVAELRSGKVETFPWADVRDRVRSKLRKNA
jgi:hypothetical protein